jgi:hypothetical protein
MDVKFEVECPCCKSNVERDFNSDYISYPTPGRKEDWYFYCDACDCEFEVPVQIDMDVTVTFEPENTKKIDG